MGFHSRRRYVAATLSAAALVGSTVVFVGFAGAAPVPAASCSPAGTTGFTATDIATQGQTIAGTVDATGCNLGIYIGPGITGVTVNGATVSNATDHAILAEDTNDITIENNTITNDGTDPNPKVAGDDAIFFAGVSNSSITDNTVTNDDAGGTRVADDGPVDGGAPDPGPAKQVASTNDTVSGNKYSNVYGGCALLAAVYNAGLGDSNLMFTKNTITGAIGQFGPHGPVIGQIVVAGDAVGAMISAVTISDNTITQSIPTGIVLHGNAPGDVITGTSITGNTLSLNNWGKSNGGPEPTAIALEAEAIPAPATPVISDTTITGNTVSAEYYGVWVSAAAGRDVGNKISANTFQLTPGGYPVYTQPATNAGAFVASTSGSVVAVGGVVGYGSPTSITAPIAGVVATRDSGGYWLAARDGNVYALGDAGLQSPKMPTSLVELHVRPAAPIVGIAATPDVSGGVSAGTGGLGYWLAAADGGVFNFGDAGFHGSAGALHLAKPIVGIASTPDGGGYWLVASDGGVFAYGDAGFFGSTGAMRLNQQIVGIAATADGKGYVLVGADGGVFTFGDAVFAGSLAGKSLPAPIVAMKGDGFVPGYYLVDANGTVYNLGAAPALPSASGKVSAGTVTGFDTSGEFPNAVAG